MTYRFIDQHKDQWPVRWLCETLEVSPAGYYAWRRSPRSAAEQRRDALLVEIRAVHAQFKARYGSPRIHAELVACGHDCCVNTVAKRMRQVGIAAKTARKFRCTTTDSNHDLPVADNLLDRQFDAVAANASWVAEIVYSQMTKPAGLAGRSDREHVTDLDVVPSHHDSIDEQLDQLPFPLKRRAFETLPHPFRKRFRRGNRPVHLGGAARFAQENLLLFRQRLITAFQFFPPALILIECEYLAQVGLREPFDLLGQTRSPTA